MEIRVKGGNGRKRYAYLYNINIIIFRPALRGNKSIVNIFVFYCTMNLASYDFKGAQDL